VQEPRLSGRGIRLSLNYNARRVELAFPGRSGSVGKYYSYGEDVPQLPNDQVEFATYTRGSATGNDYADQRGYSSALGRFMTPDAYWGSAGLGTPQKWNRYAYANSDLSGIRIHRQRRTQPGCSIVKQFPGGGNVWQNA